MALAQASEARKERLLALRRRKEGESIENGDDSKPFEFRPRNFDPETRTLRKHDPSKDEADTVEKQVEGLAELIIKEDEEKRAQDLDLLNIAPKRPNWDLRRDMDRKLVKLERKTQEAIHILIRRRLANQKDGGKENLSASIKAQERAAAADDNDSSEEDD